MKVLVLGANGMLGSMVFDLLSRDQSLEVVGTIRKPKPANAVPSTRRLIEFDAEIANPNELYQLLTGVSWVINCIGVIKPYISDSDSTKVIRALTVNAVFPHQLASAAVIAGSKVIQIATDCVYSGNKGAYSEADPHDAIDVYGKSKSLGEVRNPNMYHLRCSIIGPEPTHHISLLDWFCGQPAGSTLNGFTNHEWNGITTLHFAKICRGIIKHNFTCPPLCHIIPGDFVSKAELLTIFGSHYKRLDIVINQIEAPSVINRTLISTNTDLNLELWNMAGYITPPTIDAMVCELANFREAI